ncbi:MAG: YqiJ family protein [Firmicutes bacterium]|nr:YqiJ family protein [Bacillota bacterium]
MEHIFLIAFIVGILYSLVSFLLGQIIDFAVGDIDVDFEWENMGFFDMPVSPLKPIVIAAFMTIFGGVGVLAYDYRKLSFLLSFLIAFLIAFAGAFVIYRFIVIPLYRAQNTSSHDIHKLQGTEAVVTSSIYGAQFGKIRYVINDCTYSAPAKSVYQKDIKQGEKVLIVEVENNVFYVENL